MSTIIRRASFAGAWYVGCIHISPKGTLEEHLWSKIKYRVEPIVCDLIQRVAK